MLRDILLAELVLKGSAGLLLLLLPVTCARAFGLPHGQVGLWARLLGAVLIGLAAAVWVENDVKDVRGIGVGGLAVINGSVAITALVIAVLSPMPTRRGKIALWAMIAVLLLLSVLEIAQLS